VERIIDPTEWVVRKGHLRHAIDRESGV
jgi:hypothetical protein